MTVTSDYFLRCLGTTAKRFAGVAGANAIGVLLAMGHPSVTYSCSASPSFEPSVYKAVGERLKHLEDPATEDVGAVFHRLASKWKKETAHHSAFSQRKKHPAYEEILALGAPAIPFIIHEMRLRPALWVDALRSITGEDPVPESDIGDARKMADAWIGWAISSGCCDEATQGDRATFSGTRR